MKPTYRRLGLSLMLAMCALLPFASHAADAASPKQSLYGSEGGGPNSESDAFKRERDRAPIQRDYVQQPPLIPHTVQGYTITKNFNKCMDCHAWNRYKETGATKVSLTHFKTRDGQELSNISPRRYFCMQCHVPQTDAKPLVPNTFKPADGVK